MAKLSQADLMSQFKEMSLVELSEFVKAFETEFDVTAAAPVAAAAVVETAAPAVEEAAPAAEATAEVTEEVVAEVAAEATDAAETPAE